MDYCSIYFGRPLGQLTFEDIERFFTTEKEETDQLEFKSYHTTENLESMIVGVTAGIASFLNSSGGVLIWGAPRGVRPPAGSGRKEKIFTGALTPMPLSIEKDWLISKISDRIIPLPNGVRVQLIRRDDNQVCVFEVDESPTSPHQTDGTYYMRIDGQKKPAPHHYVEALMKKITYPDIEAYILPKRIRSIQGGFEIAINFYFSNFSPLENEEDFDFKIVIAGGEFAYSTMQDNPNTLRPGYGLGGSLYQSSKDNDQINPVYGEGILREKTINIYWNQLEQLGRNGIGKIILTFNGKKSPLKISEFEIDLNNINPANLPPVETLFRVIRQNQLMADFHAERGHSKENFLQSLGVLR